MEKTARQGQFFSNNVIEIQKFAVYINESADHFTAMQKGVNMKRILLSILAIILCFSSFSGCDTECEHNWERNGSTAQEKCSKCGETRSYTVPDTTPRERLTIEMTIAETLPSCVVFEYKDEKPYCFYAYNSEGKLCRVFWNEFAGLNEKDIIAVECDGDFKALSYDEYPDGGWTPQYEVTAISIYSEEEWNAFEQNGANEN
jgi:hypothetical protein